MGIFDDYNIDPDEIKETSFEVPDGTYRFEVAEAETVDQKDDRTSHYIEFQLTDEDGDAAGSKRQYFTLSEDGDTETRSATFGWQFLKERLKSLGITNLKGYDGSQIIGLTGVLQLRSKPGKGANKDKMFQNITSVKVDEVEGVPDKKTRKPAAKKISDEDAAAKARVKANQAKRAAAEEESEDEDENPFG